MTNDRDRRALRAVEKRARRALLEVALGARQRALPHKRYGVIYADPPWRFEPYSRITGMDRAAENHYPTSSLAEIKALNVKSIAAADCVLFLWATAPMLKQAIDVMEGWGFTYKPASSGTRIGRELDTRFATSMRSCYSEPAGVCRRQPWEPSGRHSSKRPSGATARSLGSFTK
jgi:hypothetical protein